MLLVAHLGIQAVLIVASTFMVTLVYTAIDQSYGGTTSPWVSQCTSEKKKNLPKSLQVLKDPCKDMAENQTLLVQTIILQTLWFSMVFGLLVGWIAIVFPSELLQLFGSSETVAQAGSAYCQVMIGLICLSSFSNVLENTLQGLEQAKRSAQANVVKNGTHLLLGLGGIYFLHSGVVGIAWAAILGQAAGLMYAARFLRKLGFQTKLILRPNWNFQKDALHNAAPLMADMLFYQMNNIFMFNILRSYGEVVFASANCT
ncbi:MATE family efflux transporter [Shimazuella soli]|uniref:MATE family efflux transporter n=1 Tax=Shimazuella soli TaxID=1892854 RepID=UPI001F0E59D7|nr:MATE family efflux transporter [Shimazuella soli]